MWWPISYKMAEHLVSDLGWLKNWKWSESGHEK